MVASAHGLATAVGVDVLRRGGNAVDAAVAVALALAVVYPVAGNLGGGGFMVIRLADGRATAIDYREMAPAAAHRDMYLDAKGDLVADASTVGYRAAGVPGTPAGLALALEKYGSMKWTDLVEPARRLAEGGFTVDRREERFLESEADKLVKFADSAKIFLKNGKPYREGETLRQPDLARTLERMQKRGPREFYEGETARLIAEDMRASGGLITLADLKSYRAKEREPLRGRYRGHEVITMPPPSSGGIVLLEMLQMLEKFDLAESGFGSSLTIHLQTEAMRRAFADRAEYLGDADFVDVPVARLLSPEYAAARAATIDPNRASTSAEVGPGLAAARHESEQTTHFTVVDAAGNVVSNTYTLNLGYGSGVVARGTGVLLNNEMDDFAAKPGTPNAFGLVQRESNAIAPGKRPLSSMTPTIVLDRDGQFWFALGSPGGPTIINCVLQVICNLVDFRMELQQAVDAPRVHHQWLPDRILIEPFMPGDVKAGLERRGHQLHDRARIADSPRIFIGDVHAVMVEPGTGVRLGASDSRNAGVAAGF
jgi:gamma-glutamyltranspeptidase/glutathione hydrolase